MSVYWQRGNFNNVYIINTILLPEKGMVSRSYKKNLYFITNFLLLNRRGT